MATWKDGGNYGLLYREITDEKGEHAVCKVWTKRYESSHSVKPWPEGEANFRLILKAPQMLEALKAIRTKADFMSETAGGPVAHEDWEMVLRTASTAIAVAKGDIDACAGQASAARLASRTA